MTKGIPHLFNPSSFSYYTFLFLICIGIILLVFVSILTWRRNNYNHNHNIINIENFDDAELSKALEIGKKMQTAKSDNEIKDLMSKMVGELVNVGAFPDTNQFVRKSELTNSSCVVSKAEDRDKYIAKSSIQEQGPRIDMSQYIKKSAIPACQVNKCQEPIDLSGYVKKSSLFNQKQNACVCPQVKVSAGLCKECPPCPSMLCAPCPVPNISNCPSPKPCPEQPTQPVRYEIKYIKQPVLITKTVVVDQNNNVLSQEVKNDLSNKYDGNSGLDDYIKSIKNSYVVNKLNDKQSTTNMILPTNNTKINTKINTKTTIPNIPITMSTAPCINENCTIPRNLNSAYQISGIPQGISSI